MTELASLLQVDVEDTAKKPPTLPIGSYPAIIKEREMGKSKQKQTPFIRIIVSLSGWPEGIEPSVRAEIGSVAGKTLYLDYWYSTEQKKWNYRLGKLCMDLGLTGKLDMAVERLVGQRVLASIKHRLVTTDRTGAAIEPYTVADIDELIGVQS